MNYFQMEIQGQRSAVAYLAPKYFIRIIQNALSLDDDVTNRLSIKSI